jgi:hypothetical protein
MLRFRFSILDLLWLTLVVAVALGWFVHQRQLRDTADRAETQATKWRLVAGGFEDYFTQMRWSVKWDWVSSQIVIDSPGSTRLSISTNSHEPTSQGLE